jgi:hypothetical protein
MSKPNAIIIMGTDGGECVGATRSSRIFSSSKVGFGRGRILRSFCSASNCSVFCQRM